MEPNVDNKRIEGLFGSLQQSVITVWRQHLNASKHSVHLILNDYYNDFPEVLDQLIEDYMGIFGKVGTYINCVPEIPDPIAYLQNLRNYTKDCRFLLKGESELESDLDSCLSMIDSTLYKMKELTGDEHYSLGDYCKDKIEISMHPYPECPVCHREDC